jgi:hypothetical protein
MNRSVAGWSWDVVVDWPTYPRTNDELSSDNPVTDLEVAVCEANIWVTSESCKQALRSWQFISPEILPQTSRKL